MASRNEVTLPATRPKSRKSLSHMASSQSIEDKENMTTDIGTLGGAEKRSILGERQTKKSRSKSIGPGGLDALKDGTGNRRKSVAAPLPRSILKTAFTGLREIPAHNPTTKTSPKKAGQTMHALPQQQPTVEAAPAENFGGNESMVAATTNSNELPYPLSLVENAATAETRVLLRTEEEQQAAAKDREENEKMGTEMDLKARREARRKSLANRRVSFAPEATLHTWDVVEYMQDSTTSSASTNSTRRASSASSDITGSPHPSTPGGPGSDPSEPPSTPPEQIEEIDTAIVSPAHQRQLHQKKRRRSSAIPPLNFNNPEDDDFSSSSDGSSVVGADEISQESDADDASDLDSETDDEGTAMSIDIGNTTEMSISSARSAASSSGSSARLEEALALAAQQAGTQGIDFDEHGDLGLHAVEEIVASFTPWSKTNPTNNLSSLENQENLNPFSPAFKAGVAEHSEDEDDGMTMDMTQAVGRIMPDELSDEEITMDMTLAVGGILSSQGQSPAKNRRKSMPKSRRQSNRRRSSAETSSLGDETMDLTMAIGGIQPPDATMNAFDDEDMTMEFTSVIGGVLAPAGVRSNTRRQSLSQARGARSHGRESVVSDMGDDAMDMTIAVGGIMPITPTKAEIPSHAEVTSSPFQTEVFPVAQLPQSTAVVASETGSPSFAAFKGKGLRRSGGPRVSTTPSSARLLSPVRRPTTPSEQVTPQIPQLAATSGKTPPSRNITMRTSSPKKLFVDEIKAAASTPKTTPSKKASTPNKLFQKDRTTGIATPSIILNHHRRRSSGLGIDKTGLGSPRVAAILDRRGSIGDNALVFTSGKSLTAAPGVSFDDVVAMEQEVNQAREEDMDRENGRKIMEREADMVEEERDSTVTLKEMIESLTPKKRPLKGRKSLHVGAAKGILGKRPAELDDDDDDEDEGGVKRLKNHQGSPVKNIKLNAPPSKAETTGRVVRTVRRSLEATSGNIITPTTNSSPNKASIATTPKGQGRFKDAEAQLTPKAIPLTEKVPLDESSVEEADNGEEPMQLQDFLNMTSIRFMELTTTKRRHTIAPNALPQGGIEDSRFDPNVSSLENSVIAGACTVPMLELFQHSCRELKKYISEGRGIVREIETETFEENPPLFREYISATPDVRVLMDNQFKNVKTHARLLSKAMWYEWRMKLLEGLKDGLCRISEGMGTDADLLQYQQDLLDSILPDLLRQHAEYSIEQEDLQQVAEELASCDQEALGNARKSIVYLDADIETKKQMIRDLQQQIHVTERSFSSASERKQTCLEDIREAEKIREECRGWTGNEIALLKAKVDALEQKHGWTVTGVSGTVTSLSFRGDLELVFDASSFRSNGQETGHDTENSRIDLWYIGANREQNPSPLTIEKTFFLDSIRDGVRAMPQAQTSIKELLSAVSTGWEKSLAIVRDIQSLNLRCPIETTKTSDSSIVVAATLLMIPLRSKIELQFHIDAQDSETGLDILVKPQCSVVYGQTFNEKKMTELLISKVGDHASAGKGRVSWMKATAELEEKLLARGNK